MSATTVNSIAYYAQQGGARGLEDIALHPTSTHHAEHLRRAVAARSKSSFYNARVPVWCKRTERRIFIDFPINLPSDQFETAYRLNPKEFDPSEYPQEHLPPTFQSNEVYLDTPGKTCPLGLSSDAFPTTKTDGCFA
eukprot:4952951-Pyramimonas_sp.AAC.1